MGWLDLPRVPEPEVMYDSGEVEAYSSAATQAFLDGIDDTFVEHALRLIRGRESGRALDIGTGPGQIVKKLARRLPGWRFIGVDRSPSMIAHARAGLLNSSGHSPTAVGTHGLSFSGVTNSTAGGGVSDPRAVTSHVEFFVADGNRLAFPDSSFDFVMCNSVLHHLAEPQCLFSEVARLVKPEGGILIRDLRRPSRVAYPFHVRWHGRHYSGLMYQLYCASVRSAYTAAELGGLLRASPLSRRSRGAAAGLFTHHRTHCGFERPLG